MPLRSDPTDRKLDPVTGDLVVTDDLEFISGVDGVRQGIQRRLNLFKGEWFLDEDTGTPWYQDILGQKFSEIKVRDAMRTAILDTPGAGELISMNISFALTTRVLTVSWEVSTLFDDTDENAALNQTIADQFTVGV